MMMMMTMMTVMMIVVVLGQALSQRQRWCGAGARAAARASPLPFRNGHFQNVHGHSQCKIEQQQNHHQKYFYPGNFTAAVVDHAELNYLLLLLLLLLLSDCTSVRIPLLLHADKKEGQVAVHGRLCFLAVYSMFLGSVSQLLVLLVTLLRTRS